MHENRETLETCCQCRQQVGGRRFRLQGTRVVCKESHCGIVPMNHSNQDGTSSAESEEGRLRLKENTLSSDTYPTPSGTARVPRVGECADKRLVWPLFIREKNRMR